MKTKLITTLAITTGLLTACAFAETAPASPAPMPATPVAAAATPDQVIYTAQLPSVADLTRGAAAQGLAINQIAQTARDITITYQLANGQTRTIAYELLAAGNQVPASQVTVAPASVVVVAPAPDVYYYGPYYYGSWYPRVAVRIGGDYRFRGRWR
jgi:hypothetical protein